MFLRAATMMSPIRGRTSSSTSGRTSLPRSPRRGWRPRRGRPRVARHASRIDRRASADRAGRGAAGGSAAPPPTWATPSQLGSACRRARGCRGHVDHPVVGREEHALPRAACGRSDADRPIELLERCVQRSTAIPRVGRHVELGNIDVGEGPPAVRQHRSGRIEPVGDRVARHIVGATQNGVGEARRYTGAGRSPPRRPSSAARSNTVARRCQMEGSMSGAPAGELVDHPVRRRHEGGVSDESVLAGRCAGGERREGCSRRRGESADDRRLLREQRREEAGVTGARRRAAAPRPSTSTTTRFRPREGPGVLLAAERREATGQHVGQTRLVGSGRR